MRRGPQKPEGVQLGLSWRRDGRVGHVEREPRVERVRVPIGDSRVEHVDRLLGKVIGRVGAAIAADIAALDAVVPFFV